MSLLLGDEKEPVGGSVRPLLSRLLPAPLPPLHEHLHSGHRAHLVIRKTCAEIAGYGRVVIPMIFCPEVTPKNPLQKGY